MCKCHFKFFLKLIKNILKKNSYLIRIKIKDNGILKHLLKKQLLVYDHHMNKIKTNIPFFTWFVTYSQENEIDYPYKNESINTSSQIKTGK